MEASKTTDRENAKAAEAAAPAGEGRLSLGIDVGSTTVKVAVLDERNEVRYAVYRRHHADVRATIVEVLEEAARAADPVTGERLGDVPMTIAITGSGGLLLAQWLGVTFVQEVIASKTAVETFIPATDVAIELGGEDAKIIYFDQGIEQRMNGTCAGGTGAFIDQMASLLNTDAAGLNKLAQEPQHHLPHRQPLRRVRQDRRAAAPKRGCAARGHRRLHLPIRGHPDHLGPGLLVVLSAATWPSWAVLCSTCPSCGDASTKRLTSPTSAIVVPENAHLFVASGCALGTCGGGCGRAA